MDEKNLLDRLSKINYYRKGNQRAPHKPLYLLYCIASIQHGLPRLQLFKDIEPILHEALLRFGLASKKQNPQYPFWRLQNDNLAVVEPLVGYEIRKSSDDPTKSSLIKLGARGGLTPKDHDLILSNIALQTQCTHMILDSHFPRSIHEDIINFFNLRILNARYADKQTDTEFKKRVLEAYENTCAVSGFSINFRDGFPGLEAAHICWPHSGGNDEISNGIAMTTLHRKLFHLGIIGIHPTDYSLIISSQASQLGSKPAYRIKSEGEKLTLPRDKKHWPRRSALEWHYKWVFRG